MVLPYINMDPPQVYTCSPSWTLLPPPSPYHPSGSSQCTSPKHPVLCIEPGLATRFIYDILHVSMPFSQIISPSPSPTESKILFYASVSLLLSCIQGYCYHLSKFHIYVLVYSAIKKNTFESVLMRWMKLEPIIQSVVGIFNLLFFLRLISFSLFSMCHFHNTSPMPPTLTCTLNSYSNFHRATPYIDITLIVQVPTAHLPDHMPKPFATTHESLKI